MAFEISENALKVLEKRYLETDDEGKLQESPEGMLRRVAHTVAAADGNYPGGKPEKTEKIFYEMMESLRFLPNSPTLMNAGRRLGQLSACFVLPVEDSMEGIFESVKNAALIHKSGGGTGFSFSRLRASGAPVDSTGGVASGPVSFMRVFNMATEAVKQGGTRRGANMGILRIDHPDILEFIDCKKNNADITNFNISVGLTEAFMQAAEAGEDYPLVDPHKNKEVGRLNARMVFDKIVDAAWTNGEPGILFLDRLNRDNVVPGQGEIESTNPCGEQPLLPYESCNLGSINLTKMLQEGKDGPEVDWALLGRTVGAAVHFLDNVIDVNRYPLKKIEETTLATRKIGLGVMGWADMLLMLGLPYGSEEALALAEKLMGFVAAEGKAASQKLAEVRGAFPLFGQSTLKEGPPQRNATVTTIAPTGTLSLIAGCSSGVEPVFAFVYIRNIMDNTEMLEVNPILQAKLAEAGLADETLMRKIAEAGSIAHLEELPPELRAVFQSSHDVPPAYHVRMQAAFQRHTDNAVSKTVNFAHDATRQEVAAAYKLAFSEGCKGLTLYRDGSRDSQVLNIGKVNHGGQAPVRCAECELPYGQVKPRPRPAITQGITERMKIGCGNLYVTVNYDENGICEVFTSTGKAGGCPSQSEATARLASVALRSGMSVEEIYNQLKGIRCPSTIRQSGMSCTSCPDAIAKVVKKVAKQIEAGKAGVQLDIKPEPRTRRGQSAAPSPQVGEEALHGAPQDAGQMTACPECGKTLAHEGGCVICRSCGFSRCG